MSNSASKIIVLCEDSLHEVFVRRFLRKWGVNLRLITVIPYPKGKGCGAGFVITEFPRQLNAIRRRQPVTVLIVVIDADNNTVAQRKQKLKDSLSSFEDGKSEHVCFVIPKWSIDTWLGYLDEVHVDESKSYKNEFRYRKHESDTHPLIDDLAIACKQRKKLTKQVPMPASLEDACKEFESIRDILL